MSDYRHIVEEPDYYGVNCLDQLDYKRKQQLYPTRLRLVARSTLKGVMALCPSCKRWVHVQRITNAETGFSVLAVACYTCNQDLFVTRDAVEWACTVWYNNTPMGQLEKQYGCRVWKTKAGDLIPLTIMNDRHLNNVHAFLTRRIAEEKANKEQDKHLIDYLKDWLYHVNNEIIERE